MNIISGRLTGFEIDNDARLFMETVAGWPPTKDNTSLTQELVTAFMRLSSYVANDKPGNSNGNAAPSVENDPLSDDIPA